MRTAVGGDQNHFGDPVCMLPTLDGHARPCGLLQRLWRDMQPLLPATDGGSDRGKIRHFTGVTKRIGSCTTLVQHMGIVFGVNMHH